MNEATMIAIGVSAIPDCYKERAFRYIGKLLQSSLSKPGYIEQLKEQADQRMLSFDEKRPLNVGNICQRTGEILGKEDFNTIVASDNPYEDDWLSTFENESCHKSSQEMQERFARMLAGEIKRPGTYSIRAIRQLGQIDPEMASVFRTFCSGCIAFDNPSGSGLVYTSIFPSFRVSFSSFLNKYGINNRMIFNLQEFSLLATEIRPHLTRGPALNIQKCLVGNSESPPTPFLYAGKYFLLKTHDNEKNPDWNFKMPGIFLSSLGNELINIVEPDPIEQLSEDLKEFFESKQLEMIEVELTDDKRWEPKL